MFYERNILRKHPQIANNAFKVWKIGIFAIFPISTEGIKAKLTDLESESESFLSKVNIYHFHLPITTYSSCSVVNFPFLAIFFIIFFGLPHYLHGRGDESNLARNVQGGVNLNRLHLRLSHIALEFNIYHDSEILWKCTRWGPLKLPVIFTSTDSFWISHGTDVPALEFIHVLVIWYWQEVCK